MSHIKSIFNEPIHFRDDGSAEGMGASDQFWEALAEGALPQLEQGRLMSSFSFSEPWSSWERHPAGEELVMLMSGACKVVLVQDGIEQTLELKVPGAYVLVPKGIWHTARTHVQTTLLFLTPGHGTEHRSVDPRGCGE